MPHDDTVRITVTDVGAAVPLAQPMAERIGSRRVTTLQFMQTEPSALGRLFKTGGDGIEVTVDPSPVEGGAFEWATQVRFGRRTDLDEAFARAGLVAVGAPISTRRSPAQASSGRSGGPSATAT